MIGADGLTLRRRSNRGEDGRTPNRGEDGQTDNLGVGPTRAIDIDVPLDRGPDIERGIASGEAGRNKDRGDIRGEVRGDGDPYVTAGCAYWAAG